MSDLNTYMVILPNAQLQIESEQNFEEFTNDIISQVKHGEIQFSPKNGILNYFKVSEYQYFPLVVMTMENFERYMAEMRYQAMAQQQGFPKI